MAMTHTFTTSSTFTKTDARYIASKVAADLQGMRDYYGEPDEHMIWQYHMELTNLLMEDCLVNAEYGFIQNNQRVVTLYYEVQSYGLLSDGRSGGVYARANVSNAQWFSFLTYGRRWDSLSDEEQQRIKERIPIKRTEGQAPQDGNGYWVVDKSYSSHGIGTQRRSFRPR